MMTAGLAGGIDTEGLLRIGLAVDALVGWVVDRLLDRIAGADGRELCWERGRCMLLVEGLRSGQTLVPTAGREEEDLDDGLC